MHICSGSNMSSVFRGADAIGRCLRLLPCLSIALRSPGQHLSSHACLPQFSSVLQVLPHCGCSSVPWWQIVFEVVLPHRHLIWTVFIHEEQLPLWQSCSSACPHGSVFPQRSLQCGIGSVHLVRSSEVSCVSGVFPHGQFITTSGDLGQCSGTSD